MASTASPPLPGSPLATGEDRPLEPLVGSLLEALPADRDAARVELAVQLGFAPAPAALDVLLGLRAADCRSGTRHLGLRLVAARLRVDRRVEELLGSRRIDAERIDAAWVGLGDALRAWRAIEAGIDDELARLDEGDRGVVAAARSALRPRSETDVVGAVMASRLHAIAGALVESREAWPGIAQDDAPAFARALRELDGPRGDVARECVNVMVVRGAMLEDLAAWAALRQEDASGSTLALAAARLRADEAAYRFVSERLQAMRDAHWKQTRSGLSDVDALRKALFRAFLELAPALRELPDREPGTGLEGPDRLELRPAAVRHDGTEDRPRPTPRRAPRPGDRGAAQRVGRGMTERLSVRRLATTAVVLSLACATVHVAARIVDSRQEHALAPKDLATALPLTAIEPVGPLLFARVESWTWEEMAESERLDSLIKLGAEAHRRGFEVVWIVGGRNEPVASWTVADGARLVPPRAPEASP